MRHSDRRGVEKIISSKDVDIEKGAEYLVYGLSKETLAIIEGSAVKSLKPLLDPDPAVRKEHAKKLLRQYWGLPEPEKSSPQ